VPDPDTVQLVNPNLHVILIHFPIALLFVGTFIELFAFIWPRNTFRVAGRWMILIGALAAIPAATTGMYAARQAMRQPDLTLYALKQQAQFSPEQWELLDHHWKFNSIAAAMLGVLIVVWLGSTDRVRHKAHFAFLLVLLVSVGFIATGAWHGGELVYAHPTAQKLVTGGWPRHGDVAERPAHPADAVGDKGKWVFDALHYAGEQIEKFDEPMDVHAQMAGWTVAIALATLGLSIRNLWTAPNSIRTDDLASNDDDILNAISGKSGSGEKRALMETQTSSEIPIAPVRMPAARFWLLAFLLALGTTKLGFILTGPSSFKDVVDGLSDSLRMKAHFIAGASIIVLTLLLALTTRFARHNKVLVGCFSLLLVTAIAAQVWLGALLLFDTDQGPINHFNVETTATTQPSMT
jgi:uncharacterized membrane protein